MKQPEITSGSPDMPMKRRITYLPGGVSEWVRCKAAEGEDAGAY